MDSQVAMHEYVLETLDKALIPVSDGQIRQVLVDSRGVVAEHLRMAREIRNALGG